MCEAIPSTLQNVIDMCDSDYQKVLYFIWGLDGMGEVYVLADHEGRPALYILMKNGRWSWGSVETMTHPGPFLSGTDMERRMTYHRIMAMAPFTEQGVLDHDLRT